MTHLKSCSDLPRNSRQRAICEGVSELPLTKVNSYRERWGLPPLIAEIIDGETVIREPGKPVVRRSVPASILKKGCCGGNGVSKTAIDRERFHLTDGPGTQLIKLFHNYGFESCDECYRLAEKMDAWGIEGCLQRLPEIVSDIMPRALAWESNKLGWLSKLIPGAVTYESIAHLVTLAINTNKRMNQRKIPQLTRGDAS